jgi:hypothetical protein
MSKLECIINKVEDYGLGTENEGMDADTVTGSSLAYVVQVWQCEIRRIRQRGRGAPRRFTVPYPEAYAS